MKNFNKIRQIFVFCALALFYFGAQSTTADDLRGNKFLGVQECSAENIKMGYQKVCKEKMASFELEEVKKFALSNRIAYRIDNNSLIVVANIKGEELTFFDKPYTCCDIQTYLDKVDGDLYATKIRFNNLDRSLISLEIVNFRGQDRPRFKYNGTKDLNLILSKKKSEILLEFEKIGAEYNEITIKQIPELDFKDIKIFKGSECKKNIFHCHIIYSADGGSIMDFVSSAIDQGIILNRFVFVGIANSANSDRVGELLFGRKEKVFNAFMNFVTSDLITEIEKDGIPKSRYVAGYSNGGAWALDALMLHPGKFDGAIVMSPAVWKLKTKEHYFGKKIFIGAGLLEQNIIEPTTNIVSQLSILDFQLLPTYPQAGHSLNTWVPIWNSALNYLNAH